MHDFVDHTSNATLVKKDGWPTVHTNAGATGAVALTLPAAQEDRVFLFQVEANQQFKVLTVGSDVIKGADGITAGGGFIQSDVVNSCATLRGRSGSWTIADGMGQWAFDGVVE